jgi:hypothetical protein
MERNSIRNALSERLEIEDLEYDIRVLSTERDHHKCRTHIFNESIEAQKKDLKKIIESQKSQQPARGVYQ